MRIRTTLVTYPWPSALLLFLVFAANDCRAGAPADNVPTNEAIEFFEREVRPILVSSCQECHGAKKQWAELRLDSREALLKGGESGPAVVPGDAENSLLVSAIRHTGDIQMPPEEKLSDPKIAALTRWIQLGAPWPASANQPKDRSALLKHWAFQPVREPVVPSGFGDVTQPAHVVDAFVRHKLKTADLDLSPPADRRTLIRRATFDLTGMPPTPEEVDAFVQDEDPQAYERLVDRLLASPRYGEQWGRHWLDVARYSDTKGYVYAREERFWVHAWNYRDWVVSALNADMPYDRFLMLQIAGDQVAEKPNELAAMGFLTIGRRFLGVTHDVIDDRIDVVTRGTMGLTVGCARCHDHKYDPIPTADYYSLYGIFQGCAERLVPLTDTTEANAIDPAVQKELHKRQQALAEKMRASCDEVADRVRGQVADYLYAQFELDKYPEEGFDQILYKTDILPAFVRRWQAYLNRTKEQRDPVFVAWHAYAEHHGPQFGSLSAEVTARLRDMPPSKFNPLVKSLFESPPASMREVADRYGSLFTRIDAQWKQLQQQAKEFGGPEPTALAIPAAEMCRKVLYGADAPCEVPPGPIVHTENYFDSGTCTQLWQLQGEVDRYLIQTPSTPLQAVILTDRTKPTDPRIFKRGNPANKGETVPRRFLELIAGENRQPFEIGSGRLELAEAIADPDNPLTARVIVNRVWTHHFGEGLVRTPSDFGIRAEAPSHPELLDWLASRFVAEGWSLKKLHRWLMLSQVYCQSSRGPEDETVRVMANRLDPENRLLWRMNVRRLTFEEMCDTLLAASGTLDLSVGGRPGDLFQESFKRRSLYGLIDRQFLPSTLRIFDFANPDLHIAQRTDTTVPQQALFFLNDGIMLRRVDEMAGRLGENMEAGERVRKLFAWAYQREPRPEELAAALSLVEAEANTREQETPKTVRDWSYGFGRFDECTARTAEFTLLPHFTRDAWQGSSQYPDAQLGWVQLHATGGHPGNDLAHAAVRRWTAPRDAVINIRSTFVHAVEKGDGARALVISSREGLHHMATVHNRSQVFDVDYLPVQAGDTVDFVVDIAGELNSDQYNWEVEISEIGSVESPLGTVWNSRIDFENQPQKKLGPWEQLAQVLLAANEFIFVD